MSTHEIDDKKQFNTFPGLAALQYYNKQRVEDSPYIFKTTTSRFSQNMQKHSTVLLDPKSLNASSSIDRVRYMYLHCDFWGVVIYPDKNKLNCFAAEVTIENDFHYININNYLGNVKFLPGHTDNNKFSMVANVSQKIFGAKSLSHISTGDECRILTPDLIIPFDVEFIGVVYDIDCLSNK